MRLLNKVFRSKWNAVSKELRIYLSPSNHNGYNVCFDIKNFWLLLTHCIRMFYAIPRLTMKSLNSIIWTQRIGLIENLAKMYEQIKQL
jgi:hypothetical protein